MSAPSRRRRPGAVSPNREIAPARRCAYTVLRRVFEQGAYADRAFAAEATRLERRDRALAMRLAYGTTQRAGTLDHLIEGLAQRSPAALDAPLLAALRLGLYELLYDEGAPDYAVVADAVELAKEHARAGHALVNAVLRRAGREGAGTLLATLTEEDPERAALKHSHPEWIARMWWETLGAEQACALMAADNEPLEVALRANTLVSDAATLAGALPVATHRDGEIPEALVLEGPFDSHASPLWHEGAFYPQSRAAMLVSRTLAPEAGERVLELCAAPGGKSTHLAALMEGEGEVVAVERNPQRAEALARTARRLRAANVRVVVAAAERWQAQAPFERVLVDPPCSGLGTLQARADLRWRVTPQTVAELARIQSEILAAGARAVRPGGVLVYSTCTISPPENEHVIASFLASNPEFEPAGEGERATGAFIQTLPHRDRTAGFFIARLRRR